VIPSNEGSSEWQRPVDWLLLPTVTSAEQKFVGLYAVWEDGDNVVAFLFRGAYTVDWGDGVVENVADNVKAEHQYSWASIPSNTTTSQGYRQVIITVTPNGGNLTSCNFQQRYTARNQSYTTGFLDVTLSIPNASAGASITFGGTTVGHRNVERATVLTIGSATDISAMFRECRMLQSLPLFNTASVTLFALLFNNCSSIKTVPLFNTSSATNFSGMFQNCSALIEVPLFNTALVQVFGTMFSGCSSLKTIPLLNTVSGADFSQMFNSATALQDLPLINTSLATTMNAMFLGTASLRSIPALSTANITTATGTDFGNFSFGNSSLARCEMVFARQVSFNGSGLSAPALVEIFTNLVDRSATTSATITITGNWGVASLTAGDLLIATSKNWVVAT
jgi:hypothetical protein